MKKILTKVGYMAFGSLLTLIGYHFGNIDNNSADAQGIFQEKAPIVDEIRCRKLVIVGDDGTQRIILGTNVLPGYIQFANKDGATRVLLGVDLEDSGTVIIQGKDSSGKAAQLGVDQYGGYMALWNKLIDRAVLLTGISDKGEGYVFTRDKGGYQTGALGPKGTLYNRRKSA